MAKASRGITTLRPVEVSATAAQQVTKEIRRAILAGELRPNQIFSLREIAGQLRVSFIPVREALRALESEGLIVSRPGRSSVVAPLSANDLHGIYRLRRHIEPEIAARSCVLLTDGDFENLSSYIDIVADPAMGIDDIYEPHHEFHMGLLRPAATAWDLRTLSVLWHAAERYIRLAFGSLDDRPDEHERRATAHDYLIREFRTRNPQRAHQALLEHLQANELLAQSALETVID